MEEVKRFYCTDGMPLDIAKREAKKLKRADDIKLHEAQDKLARRKGYENWSSLVGMALYTDDQVEEHFTFSRKIGQDTISFCFADLVEDWWNSVPDGEEPRHAILERELNYMGSKERSVDIRITFKGAILPGDYAMKGVTYPVQPRLVPNDQALFEMIVAAEGVQDAGTPGPLIAVFQKLGLFDIDPWENLRSGDHEAFLELNMRKLGIHLGERVVLNTTEDRPEPKGELDYARRCFLNKLSDGRYVVSNGGGFEDDLIFRIIDEDEFQRSVAALTKEFPAGPNDDWASEAWMRDLLLPAPNPRHVPPEDWSMQDVEATIVREHSSRGGF